MVQLFLTLIMMSITISPPQGLAQSYQCDPTPPDLLGPYYRPNAPERNQVGTGYVLTGEVKSALTCTPISGARIEVWMAGPDGQYSNDWRATIFSNSDGSYRFSSPFPGYYGNRPPHIHMITSAPGFQKLTTQHYALQGTKESRFDLVLIPNP